MQLKKPQHATRCPVCGEGLTRDDRKRCKGCGTYLAYMSEYTLKGTDGYFWTGTRWVHVKWLVDK